MTCHMTSSMTFFPAHFIILYSINTIQQLHVAWSIKTCWVRKLEFVFEIVGQLFCRELKNTKLDDRKDSTMFQWFSKIKL